MGGFLGFANFQKVGKGVKKQEVKKRRIFQFFDIYGRKFGKLIKLNVLFIICCIPIVTIGPAVAAMLKITRYYVEEKPVFLFSDFFQAFKENFAQSFMMSIISGVGIVSLYFAFVYYFYKCLLNLWFFIPLALIAIIAIIFIFASFYSYLLICSVSLNFFAVLKNSIMLAFLGLKSNLFSLFFAGGLIAISATFLPLTIPILILFTFATTAMIVCFNSFQYIYRYIIKPYYEKNDLPDPYVVVESEEESIFADTI